ncbi:DUF11 domain-containing protein [Paractinoplanes rishiriensis]|uniref:DUF11 domain-containing protein n=1 Tax=Paractinoplanes rishiriensis TaxID=1050105 RepID=A0A919K4Z5_9ACTN|nr:DUF11 domain-containing protein [Actinoplanes rishiriensis]GIE99407.1 hypothetical protein Ari01nite_68720 [Actinoplanes rishiriensis]
MRRLLVGTAIAVLALLSAPVPAAAAPADPAALAITRPRFTYVGVGNIPYAPLFVVSNQSDAAATDVRLTADLTALADGVRLDGVGEGCTAGPAAVTCAIGDLGAGIPTLSSPVRLVAPAATAEAPAGELRITLSSAAGAGPAVSFPVRFLPPGPDLTLVTEPPAGSAPNTPLYLPMALTNNHAGTVRTERLVLTIPRGVGINHDTTCVFTGGTSSGGMHWGPVEMSCPVRYDVEPGDTIEIIEPGSSPPRYYAMLRTDTPGPATYRGEARIEIEGDDRNPRDNTAPLIVKAAANKLDAAVTTRAVRTGNAATVTATIRNAGPSSATGWTADLTAPAGTVFRSRPGCALGAAGVTLRCTSTDWLAPRSSATLTAELTVAGPLGAAGSVTVGGTGPSTDSEPSNNRAAITLTAPDDDETLPITGPSGAAAGLAAIAVGALLLLATRRRT